MDHRRGTVFKGFSERYRR